MPSSETAYGVAMSAIACARVATATRRKTAGRRPVRYFLQGKYVLREMVESGRAMVFSIQGAVRTEAVSSQGRTERHRDAASPVVEAEAGWLRHSSCRSWYVPSPGSSGNRNHRLVLLDTWPVKLVGFPAA